MNSLNSHKIAKYSKLLNNTSDRSMAEKYRQKLGYYQGQLGGLRGGFDQTKVDELKGRIDAVITSMQVAKNAGNLDEVENLSKQLPGLQEEINKACADDKKEKQILLTIPALVDCEVEDGEVPPFGVAAFNGRLDTIRGGPVQPSGNFKGVAGQNIPSGPTPQAATPTQLGGYYNYNETEDIGNWVNRLIN